jgi:hypothetical protein
LKAICTFCGQSNSVSAQTCAQCGGALANARRQRSWIPWASWVPAIPVAALLWFQFQNAEQSIARANTNRQQLTAAHQNEIARLRAEHDKQESELEAKHRALLSDTQFVSGATATQRHTDEWKRRQKHDPEFARTLLEKTLLEVERVGKDPSLTAETALRKVAELVTPPRSRVEIKQGDSGFMVRVAYRLSAVRPEESGGATHHNTSAEMRAEIEHVTAQVMKDLFDYCGARGIERLSVSSNRALVIGKDDERRLVMRSLYRAVVEAPVAAGVSSWREISASEVAKIMHVEHDVLAGIIITFNRGQPLVEDPNAPLEF